MKQAKITLVNHKAMILPGGRTVTPLKQISDMTLIRWNQDGVWREAVMPTFLLIELAQHHAEERNRNLFSKPCVHEHTNDLVHEGQHLIQCAACSEVLN